MVKLGKYTIHPIVDDKESWENIPQVVQASLKLLNDNFKTVGRWALDQENDKKEAGKMRFELDQRIKEANQKLELAQDRLKFLFVYTNQLFAHQKAECRTMTTCIQQHLGATRSQFKSFGHAFGVNIDTKSIEQDEFGNLQVLVRDCAELDAKLQDLDKAFSSWETWRNQNLARISSVEQTMKELQNEGERTQERLCSWRETIRENEWSVKSLNDMLAETNDMVYELRQSRVTQEEMDDAVGDMHKELLGKISDEVENRTVATKAIDNRCDILLSELKTHAQETDQRMDRHNTEVLSIMQSNLVPVTSYLNSMHVKADDVKAQLTVIQKELPILENGLEEARALIKALDHENHSQFLLHNGQIQGLDECVQKHNEQFLTERAMWTSSMETSKNEIDARMHEVTGQVKATESIQEAHGNRVVIIEESMNQLQQKVAKWVHTQPLPLKVSEARIFALEARINEEIDRRLQLQAQLETPATTRPHSRFSPSPSPGLPKLAKNVTPMPPVPPSGRPPSADHLTGGRRVSIPDTSQEAELTVSSVSERKK